MNLASSDPLLSESPLVRVVAEAGDLILWDSRTVLHACRRSCSMHLGSVVGALRRTFSVQRAAAAKWTTSAPIVQIGSTDLDVTSRNGQSLNTGKKKASVSRGLDKHALAS